MVTDIFPEDDDLTLFQEGDVEAILAWEVIVRVSGAAKATWVDGTRLVRRDYIEGIKTLFALNSLLRRIDVRQKTDPCFISKSRLIPHLAEP